MVALCCALFISSYAQKNLQHGFVVLNNGDTLKGFIDYREWYKNPNSVLFSQSKDTGRQWYKVKDITCFAINEAEMYQRYIVRISMDKQLMGNIGEKDTSGRTDSVFLKVLQKGNNVTLFSYSDDVKKRLYILPAKETTPVELQNSEFITDGQVVNEKEYQLVLMNIARRYATVTADIQIAINSLDYSQNSIMNVCYKINGISPGAAGKQIIETGKPPGIRFFAGIGVNRGLITFNGSNHYAGITKGATFGPVADAGADIFVNPAIGKMFVRSQLTYSDYETAAYTYAKYFEAKENYYLKFKQRNIAVHEQLIYNLYNGKNMKWFAGAGAGFNFSSYPYNQEIFIRQGLSDTSSSINDNYVREIKKFWLNAVLKSGFAVHHFDIAVAYYPKSSLSQNTIIGVDNSSLQL